MSMRSANNKRTQNREYTGATRRSAGSAKPARAAASSVRVVASTSKQRRQERERGESLEGLSREEKRARKRELRARDDRVYNVANIMVKQDADYKKRRIVFWTLIGIGVVILIALWFTMFSSDEAAAAGPSTVQIVGMVLAYAAVIGSIVYDFVRIRPLRNYYHAQAEGMTDAKIVAYLERVAMEREAKKSGKGATASTASSSGDKAKDAAAAEQPQRKRGPKKNHRSRR